MISDEFKYSVLFTTYYKDNSKFMEYALESIFKQTIEADEIIIAIDTKISDEQLKVIESFNNKKIKLVINHTKGLGQTLQNGVIKCKNKYILRMDSDDISKSDRAELMLKYLIENQVDVLGSGIDEFNDDLNNLINENVLKDISQIFIRNPLNHPTVLLKKESVIAAGNYLPLENYEDWYLWLRMKKKKFKIANFPNSTLFYRVNKSFFRRRSGYKYLLTEFNAFRVFFKEKLIPIYYCPLIFFRLLIRFLPVILIEKLYHFIRKI